MRFLAAGLALCLGRSPMAGEVPVLSKKPAAAGEKSDATSRFVFSLLPKAFQAKPRLEFNVITEMTDEGRKAAAPTAGHPIYYVAQAGAFVQTGSALTGGEKAPPTESLDRAMRKSLEGAGYLPAGPPGRGPQLAIVFNYGSHSADFAGAPGVPTEDADGQTVSAPVMAEELLPIVVHDRQLQRDLLERAALVGGSAFAMRLKEAIADEIRMMEVGSHPINPEVGSPFQILLQSNPRVAHLVEDAFHSCYFVIASAYDYADLSRGRKRLLWRTKMTVDASGVNMTETLTPLIASAAPYLGKDMSEAVVVEKRISREGRVEIGTPTVVEDKAAAPGSQPATPAPAQKP